MKDEVGWRLGCRGWVKINEGDVCVFMYNYCFVVGFFVCVDVVDFDFYGIVVFFFDVVIGCIFDGGFFVIICIDFVVFVG